jgi:biopolymer transport protein ExbD
MIHFETQSPPPDGIDLTPLIDVVFQLLVFFLLTSAFINPGIAVELPVADTGEVREALAVSVSIDPQGRIFIGDREVLLDNFRAEILKETEGKPGATVVVWGDTAVSYGRFIQVLDICRGSGLKEVVLMVAPSGGPPVGR